MTPGIFRQRPATVEAMVLTRETEGDILRWAAGRAYALYPGSDRPYLVISTPSGSAVAHDGQYVVRDPSGRFRVVEAEAFASTFEPVVEVGHD